MVCENCMAFDYTVADGARCRRRAPTLDERPRTTRKDWCLDFVPDLPTQQLIVAQTDGTQ